MSSGRKKIVFDTSTLVACCLTPEGLPKRALIASLDRCTVVASSDTLTELVAVLQRPKFDAWRQREQRLAFLAGYASAIELHEPRAEVHACRDPKDDKFLSLAMDVGATWLISSDDDLLVLDPFEGTRILSPAAFIELLAMEAP